MLLPKRRGTIASVGQAPGTTPGSTFSVGRLGPSEVGSPKKYKPPGAAPGACPQCGANSIEPSPGGAAGTFGERASGEGSGSAAGTGAGTGGVAAGSCRRVGVLGLCCALLRAPGRCAWRFDTLPSARRRPPPPDTTRPRFRTPRAPGAGFGTAASTRGRPTSAGRGGGAGGASKLGATRSARRIPAAATSTSPA
ncbi:MAG: hypothetical protein QOF85_1230 [Solirubrobacterales bacterium]|nr:hypothetical protein [Solirubrobacterales bacterium]